MQCNICLDGAILVVPSMRSDLRGPILVVQSMQCNLCGAIYSSGDGRRRRASTGGHKRRRESWAGSLQGPCPPGRPRVSGAIFRLPGPRRAAPSARRGRGPLRAQAAVGEQPCGPQCLTSTPVPYQCLTSALPVPYPVPYLANPMNLHAGRFRDTKVLLLRQGRRVDLEDRTRPACKFIGFAR